MYMFKFIYMYIYSPSHLPSKKKNNAWKMTIVPFSGQKAYFLVGYVSFGEGSFFLGAQGSEKNHDPPRWTFRTDCYRWVF